MSDILGRKNLEKPSEISIIKEFVEQQFDSKIAVSITVTTIIITTNSAALANALRMQLPELKRITKTDKKIIFRING